MKNKYQLALLLVALLGLALALAVPATQAAGPPGIDLPPLTEEPPKGPPGLEWSLAELVAKEAEAKPTPPQLGPAAAPEPVRVVVEAMPGRAEAAATSIVAASGRVESTYGDLVQALVPISALEGLTKASGVRYIRRPLRPMPVAVTSQGVSLVGATAWQQAGLTGRGVKVAIVDVGFKGYTLLLGTELPLNTIAKSYYGDPNGNGDINGGVPGTPHGTAVAEIVHDIAPNAQLYLVNNDTEVELGNAVDWLISQGVSVISHSVVWRGGGSGDGTGPMADIVARARQSGILWVNAAGNEAQRHWWGNWNDNGNVDTWLNFTPTDETNTFSVSAGSTIDVLLTWDDPWGASTNDYDLYLLDSNLNVVASSRNWQSGFQNPVESIEYAVPAGTYHVKIKRYGGTKNSKLSLFVYPQTPEYRAPAGSLLPPADSASALAVGAVPWSSPEILESLSSRGPTLDGRTKPDLVAPDGVGTATYASFYGTSAATPHVAGAAALVRQLYSGMSPAQLKDFLKGRGTDLGDAGPDNLYGWGRLSLGTVAIVSLWLTPASQDVLAYDTFQLTVEADATQTPIDEVAVFIDFDPAYLEVLYIQPGPGLSNTVTSQINNVQGIIDYVASGSSQSGRFTLATFTFTSKDTTVGSPLSFSSQQPRQTRVRVSGQSVLHRTVGSLVKAWGLPVAAFDVSPTQGLAPLTVQFTDLSRGAITRRVWDFGDGTTSDQRNPIHTYARLGNYSVSLTVSNPAASDIELKIDHIEVYQPPTANFQAQPLRGEAPLVVQFSDLSTGSISYWLWTFGDGTTSTLSNPSHEYASSGNYTVSLAVEGPAGSSRIERQGYISVSGSGNVQGQVLLQGRGQHNEARISLAGTTPVAAQPDGRFSFSALPAGYYSLALSAPGFLAQGRQVQVVSGQTASLPPVRLVAGDVNGDSTIDVSDLVAVATQFNTPGTGTATDLNGDGWVDIVDLTLVGQNLGLPK